MTAKTRRTRPTTRVLFAVLAATFVATVLTSCAQLEQLHDQFHQVFPHPAGMPQ
ncbi:hypothetical protein [Mycobacterium simulans]|uniref:hypothetical protein n=1 Tax=Mycobacterium simulans TaxID=627089 RepID=UPI001640C207|nr:hypothetical protein [Mycobacterium simulans]